MISKEQIRQEIEFYEELRRGYADHINNDFDSSLFFKYQHGKWRPYLWEQGREKYLSTRKHGDEIARRMETSLFRECMDRIEKKIELLTQLELEFTDFEELEPAYIAEVLEREKGIGFKIREFMPQGCLLEMYSEQEEAWVRSMGMQNPYRPENKVHTTPGGVKVRSKSELVIGTFLEMKHIPYKYEEELLVEGSCWYPDFKVRRPRDGKVIIWEHLGMMDNEDYAEKNQYKLMVYARNGYRMWENMIVTYDENGSFDMVVLNKIYDIMLK